MIDYMKVLKAHRHLEAQFNNFQTLDANLDLLLKEAVQESVIQRFETCYDCLWKALKRYLVEELGLPDVPNCPKPVFRIANENNLLKAPVEKWLGYADARVDTSHDYSGEKAMDALNLMAEFIQNSSELLKTLTGKN